MNEKRPNKSEFFHVSAVSNENRVPLVRRNHKYALIGIISLLIGSGLLMTCSTNYWQRAEEMYHEQLNS